MKRLFTLLILTLVYLNTIVAHDQKSLELQTYAPASQVMQRFATQQGLEHALAIFQDIGIQKIYLETVRHSVKPDETVLVRARDFFEKHGVEVAGGVTTTTNGPGFGSPSTGIETWLNYQSPVTEQDMAEHFRWIAGLFDEIMVDDFLATCDESEISQRAKGNRTWETYRIELLAEFSKKFMIDPASAVNPNVHFIIKYPQ